VRELEDRVSRSTAAPVKGMAKRDALAVGDVLKVVLAP
jgi:hypothetical protein